MPHIAEAATVGNVEGNMGGAIMRGAVAPPESQTTSRRKGARRNLGDLLSPAAASAVAGRAGKLGRASPTRMARGVGRLRSVRLAAGVSGGLKSHSIRGPGSISEGRGNASPARVDGRYGEASEARRRKPGDG